MFLTLSEKFIKNYLQGEKKHVYSDCQSYCLHATGRFWGLVLERVYYGPHRNALLVFCVG